MQHEHASLRRARSFTTGRPQGRVCGPLYSTCATARVVLAMQPPQRSCSGRISALTARDAWRATQTVSNSLRCCDSNDSNAHLCLRAACSTCASRPRERAGGSDTPFPRPRLCWLGGGRHPPCGGGDTCNTSMPRFGVLDPSQRAARKDACAAPSTRPVPWHRSF